MMAGGAKAIELKTRVGVDGETTYRDALKNIGRQLQLVKTEAKAVTSAFGDNQHSVEALTAKQKALGEQQKVHAEKVKVLSEMLEIAKRDFGESSEEADQYRIKLANAQTALNKCSNELSDVQSELEQQKTAAKEAGDKHAALQGVLAGAAKTMGGVLVTGAKAAAAAMAALTAAAAAAVKAGFDLSVGAGKYADDLATLSTQTGISQKSLQEWAYASNFIDTSVEIMTQGMSKMTQAMGDAANGNKETSARFATLGVSIKDVHGRLRSSEDVFWDTIDALGKIENETERDAAAMKIFGEQAKQLNPLIEAGSKAFREMGDEARRMGTVFTDEEIATMGGFDDEMQRAKASAEGLKTSIGLALIPAFQPLVGRATAAMAKVSTALRDGISPGEIGELVDELLDEASGALDDIIGMIGDALPEVSDAIGRLVGALGEKLPGMIDRILPAAMGLLQSVLTALSSNAGDIGRVAGQLVGQLGSFLIKNIPALLSAAWELAKGLLDGLLQSLKSVWVEISGDKSVTEFFAGIWEKITGCFGSLAGILEDVLNLPEGSISEPVNAVMETLKGYFGGLWDAITGCFGSLMDIVEGLLSGEISVEEALEQATKAVKDCFDKVWSAITGCFGSLAGILEDVLSLPEGSISEPVNAVMKSLKEYFGGLWEAITGCFGSLKDIVEGLLSGEISADEALEQATKAVKDCFEKVWSAITGCFGNLADILESVLSLPEGSISEPVNAVMESLKGYFGGLWDAITGCFGTLKDIVEGMLSGEISVDDALENAIKAVKDCFSKVWGAICGIFGSLSDIVKVIFGGESGGSKAKQAAENGWKAAEADVKGVFTGIWGDILGCFGSLADWFGGIFDGVGTAIQSAWDAVKESVGKLLGGIWSEITGYFGGKGTAVHDTSSGRQAGGSGKGFGDDGQKQIADAIVSSAVSATASGIEGSSDEVAEAMTIAMQAAIDTLNAMVASGIFSAIGLNISRGIALGIQSGTGAIVQAARRAARLAYATAQRELDIHSPSRRMAYLGEQTSEGFAQGVENRMYRIADAAAALAGMAQTKVATVRGGSIDYAELAAANAAAMDHGSGATIDYDRMGEAVAQANRDAGVGQATIVMDKREVGRTVEPTVSGASAQRGTRTIAGRPAQLILA